MSHPDGVYTGVGGIEAEAVMLGQTISMVLPKVVGYKLIGDVGKCTTSTDVVLTITKVIFSLFFLFGWHGISNFVLLTTTFPLTGFRRPVLLNQRLVLSETAHKMIYYRPLNPVNQHYI